MDWREFIVAITADWTTLMSGIASVILLIFGVVRKWGSVPRWAFWTAAMLCFFFASARVWTIEHRTAISNNANADRIQRKLDELTQPKLVSSLDQVNIAEMKNGQEYIAIVVAIRNLGSPSIVEGYALDCTLPEGTILHAQLVAIPNKFQLQYPDHSSEILYGADELDRKTAIPIPSGGIVRGRLFWAFPLGVTMNTLKQSGVKVTLTFHDINGKTYSLIGTSSGREYSPHQDFPGLERQPRPPGNSIIPTPPASLK